MNTRRRRVVKPRQIERRPARVNKRPLPKMKPQGGWSILLVIGLILFAVGFGIKNWSKGTRTNKPSASTSYYDSDGSDPSDRYRFNTQTIDGLHEEERRRTDAVSDYLRRQE